MMITPRNSRIAMTLCIFMLALSRPVLATWSFTIADKRTHEVGVGTVTCLTSFDLKAIVPVIVVGKGAAAVQAAGDFGGQRRPVIFAGLGNGTAPAFILQQLAGITGHQQRQYGIADTQGRVVTFTGNQTFPWRGGVTGEVDDFVYAVQGNVLAGSCVRDEIEAAIINTPGDLAEKMMAAHRAARDAGGDGRCSCSQQNPTGCGCPTPPAKSGHIGCMVIARIGDSDDPLCNAQGCADGDYFMSLNVPFQTGGAPDPVDQLQALFDSWRNDLVGRPDAVQTRVSLTPVSLIPGRAATSTMTIDLRDWQGQPVSAPISSVTVEHAAASTRRTSIGPVFDNGNGTFSVVLTNPARVAGLQAPDPGGIDRFRIVVDDSIRPVTLMPEPTLPIRRSESPVPK